MHASLRPTLRGVSPRRRRVRPGVASGVPPRTGPSIWIIHRGRAVVSSATNKDRPPIDVAPGAVLFVDAGEELSVVVGRARPMQRLLRA